MGVTMSQSDRGTQFLDEFKEFLAFLKNLWGVLAGVSVLFPMSNVLAKIVPLQPFEHGGAFAKITPSLVTTLATISTLFLILWTFGHRSKFKAQPQRRTIQRQAVISFMAGLLALVLYLVGYSVTLANAFDVWGWASEDPRHLLAEIPLLVTYVASFALVTRAFVLLGMMEFFSTEQPS